MTTPGTDLARTADDQHSPFLRGEDSQVMLRWQHTLNALEDDVAHAEALAAGRLLVRDDGPDDGPAAGDPVEVLTDASLTLASLPGAPGPWSAPPHLGPLPPQLVDRARELLDRQITAAATLARTIAVGRQQAAYATHVDSLYDTRRNAAFVDEAV